MILRPLAFVAAFAAAPASAQTNPNSVLPGNPCHGQTPCALDGREYHVKEPDGWDGVTPLPVLLHFHGWARTGKLPVNHGRISGATRRRDVLLLAPTGRNKTWNFRQSGSPDVTFADAVLADAAKRYPIDTNNIFVSGYSFGGLMAWRYACESSNNLRAVMSVSATLATSGDCANPPTEFREVYGVKDNVLPFPFGPNDETTWPVIFWRTQYGCPDVATQTEFSITGRRDFIRHAWDCGPNSVTLDVHPGGHLIPRGWIGRQLDDLLNRAPSYP